MSNNPPDVSLELTAEQAKFLLRNCNSNMAFALNAIQEGTLKRETLEKLIELNEQFKTIRQKLVNQGVTV